MLSTIKRNTCLSASPSTSSLSHSTIHTPFRFYSYSLMSKRTLIILVISTLLMFDAVLVSFLSFFFFCQERVCFYLLLFFIINLMRHLILLKSVNILIKDNLDMENPYVIKKRRDIMCILEIQQNTCTV